MYPILLRIGNFPIHSYGVMIAIGFLCGVWFVKYKSEITGLPSQKVVDLAFFSLLVGLVGSRFFFVLTQLSEFAKNPLSVFYVWEGGLVFYGGPIFCIPFYYWYTKRFKLPVYKIMDIDAQGLALAHAFGRIGCLLAGCCYGKPTGIDGWGVEFYSTSVDESMRGIKLHPTQAYEAVALFGIFFFLNSMSKKKLFDGQIALLYLILYSSARFVIEYFRGDVIRGFIIDPWISTSQLIALVLYVGAIIIYIKRTKKRDPH